MNAQSTTQTQTAHQVHDELILVVKQKNLFQQGAWQGMHPVDYKAYAQLIQEKAEFLPRSQMESDLTYKQIIPYLVFTHENKYFLMQRRATTTEVRLKNKYSLGIGGHINQEDIQGTDIAAWARREFDEEVNFAGTYHIEALGLLNDDSNAVGQVHAGFVFLLRGDSSNISVKSELKSGTLYSLTELDGFYDNMETWSQIIVDYLHKA
jgi:Predicted phosphoesterase (MutT family)